VVIRISDTKSQLQCIHENMISAEKGAKGVTSSIETSDNIHSINKVTNDLITNKHKHSKKQGT
jgi:hypothetical protein